MKAAIMILGTEYRIKKKKYKRGSYFVRKNCDGYCNDIVHEMTKG